MPELPEVETVVRDLRAGLVGARIADCWCSGLRLRQPLPAAPLRKAVVGAQVLSVRRRGKYILVELSSRQVLLIHLGMSGRLELAPIGGARVAADGRPRHTHLVLRLKGQPRRELRFVDPRRFGLVAVHPSTKVAGCTELRRLGPDPLERGFTPEWLRQALAGSRRDLKSFLLDQQQLAGVGNIYACEALFAAGLHPRRRCQRVSAAAAGRLCTALRNVLTSAIARRGTSLRDYFDAAGQPGNNAPALCVYGREGEPCPACGARLRRTVQSGRSTFYCPRCQR